MRHILFLLLFLLVTACGARYIDVVKIPVGKESLVSNFTETPDPLKEDPPVGEKLYVSWRVPFSVNPKECQIRLKMIYKDLSEEEIVRPVDHRIGTFGTPLLREKYEKTKGFYSYKATLETLDGSIIDTWKQLMWVELER